MNKINNNNKRRDDFPMAIICVIIIITLLLLLPLVAEVSDKIPIFTIRSDNDPKTLTQDEEKSTKSYKTRIQYIDGSLFDAANMELISVKARNNGEIIFIYLENAQYYGTVLRLMKQPVDFSGGGVTPDVSVTNYIFPMRLNEAIINNNYTYIDFDADGHIFISYNKMGYLLDSSDMKLEKLYKYPEGYDIYQAVLSGSREKIAFAAESGFYIADSDFENIKELVSTVHTLNDAVITSQFPVWDQEEEYIFYRIYVNGNMAGVGKTSVSPGNNRQYMGSGSLRFEFLSDGRIFYHQSSSYGTGIENQFVCGYFDIETTEMKDIIKSSVYYYDIKTGYTGNFIAALSTNGLLKKLNIIDIHSKKIIYNELFDEIKEFCFSPDETKLLIRAVKDGEDILILVDIYEIPAG